MKIYIISSGSKGNSTLIESNGHLLLIDLGISFKRLRGEIETHTPYKAKDVEAILFTHDHSDHICPNQPYDLNKYYTSSGTYNVYKENILVPYNTYEIAGFTVEPIQVSHDAINPIGFLISSNGEKLCYITDTGYISEKNIKIMKNCDFYILESNHNVRLLLKTNRPPELKQRIMSEVGHLNNEDSALYMCQMIGSKTKEIILAHISEEANTPEVALETYRKIFIKNGINPDKYYIHPAWQWEVTKGGDNDN